MTVDLLHNEIVKGTITEGFTKSINENLIPKLYALYGTSLVGIQMYEDYIKDEFVKDGYMYYPMTVNLGGVNAVIWIKWDISDSSLFSGGVPYSYLGEENIDFMIAEDVPSAFKQAIEERANYFEGGQIKTHVSTDAPGATILAGKYSQTFVDEMARQLTSAIARACGVTGLAESSIELNMVFAPNTYMEHTSENVTYRRLLISAKGCAPRDFWVKWTRLDANVAFSVNDTVNSDNIRFEIGEDVSHKIREKEYRFLVYGNSDKYRVAMGRKNITEWREIIKRALKRGELEKTAGELEEDARVAEVSDKLSQILEKCGVAVPAVADTSVPSGADIANEALRMAVFGDSLPVDENEADMTAESEDHDEFDFNKENENIDFILKDGIELTLSESDDMPDIAELIESAESQNDESEGKKFIYEEVKDVSAEGAENLDNSYEESAETEEADAKASSPSDNFSDEILAKELEYAREEAVRLRAEVASARRAVEDERMAKEDVEKYLSFERLNASDLRAQIEKQNVAISDLKRLIDEEANARKLAQVEADRLRAENENITRENMRLVEAARISEEACREAELKCREQEEKLREQIELQEKERVREKLLFAEEARQAREEEEREAKGRDESQKLYEDNSPLTDKVSAESEVPHESDAVLQKREKEERRAAAKERAEVLRRRMEEEARRDADLKASESSEYSSSAKAGLIEEPMKEPIGELCSEAKGTPYVTEDYKEPEISSSAPDSVCVPIDEMVRPVINYTYTSKLVRLMFKNTIDPNVTVRIHELISVALTEFKKEDVYIKVKASIPDNATVVLNFVKYPEEEMQLLVDIIHFLGNSDLGIYKIILE